jgi:UDP-glucose 4-epimerase
MPMSPYAASKLAAESYALAHASSFGLDVLAFRFFNVFGPLQPAGHAYAAVIPAFIDAALAGIPLPVHGDGRQTRDFTYVGTVAAVLTDAVTRHVTSDRPVNLAFGSRVSLLELADVLGKILGHELALEHRESRIGDVRDSQADQTRLRALFPDVTPVDLEAGLRETVAWFRR